MACVQAAWGEALDSASADGTVVELPEGLDVASLPFSWSELVEGARARQCRIAIDGPTFLAAFPQAKELVGDADLAHWRGEVDYWVFLDDQIGRIEGSVNGDAADIQKDALQATVRVALTATDRDQPVTVSPPAG
jgi:hypothetical protein